MDGRTEELDHRTVVALGSACNTLDHCNICKPDDSSLSVNLTIAHVISADGAVWEKTNTMWHRR